MKDVTFDSMQEPAPVSAAIDADTRKELVSVQRWTRLAAIMGFAAMIFGIIASFFAPVYVTNVNLNGVSTRQVLASTQDRVTMIGISLVFAALVFYPVLSLYRFSGKTKTALRSGVRSEWPSAFRELKKAMRYLALLIVLIVLFYGGILFLQLQLN
jgi:hypothetical protein